MAATLAMAAALGSPPITFFIPLNCGGGGCAPTAPAAAAAEGVPGGAPMPGDGIAFTLGTTGFLRVYFLLAVVGSLRGFFLGLPRLRFGGSVSPSKKKFWAPYAENGLCMRSWELGGPAPMPLIGYWGTRPAHCCWYICCCCAATAAAACCM